MAVARLLEALPELDDVPQSGREEVPQVADGEQRIATVVVLRDEPEGTFARARLAAESHGLSATRAPDGTISIVVSGSGTAADHATRAARCALSVQRTTRAQLSVATGLSRPEGDLPSGRAYDAALVALILRNPIETRRGSQGSAIVLDESTATLLDSRFDVRQGERGYVLRGVRETYEPARTVLGRRTRCVGRRREMSMLTAMLGECIEDSVSGAVLITGPPGIGKSRLAYEVSRMARRSRENVRVLRASAEAMSHGVSYSVFAQACQRACGIDESLTASARRAKLQAHLGLLFSAGEETRVGEFLLEAFFPQDDPASTQVTAARRDSILRGDQIKRALCDWLGAECRKAPVLLILDDLQWADRASIHLIDDLLRQLSDSPLMIVALARPEIHDVFSELWTKRGVTELRLGGLSRRAAAEMVTEALGDEAPTEIVERVISRAQGNPFWLEELVRAEHAGQGEEVPDRILLLGQSRIGQLSSDARRAVRLGSIFGRHFWAGAVRHLLGRDRAKNLDVIKAELIDAELVVKKDLSRFPDEEELEFSSGLLRDAAYSLLSDDEKERAHARAAEWLEARGDADALPIAMHFTLGGEAERARPHYLRAAVEALSGNDFEQALSCVEEGLSTGPEGHLTIELQLVCAEAARWRGDNERALQAASWVRKAARPGSPAWFRATADAGVAASKSGKPRDCVQMAHELLEIARLTPEDSTERVVALARIAGQLVRLDQRHLAKRLLELAARDQERLQPDPIAAGFLCAARGALAEASGDPLGQLAQVEQAAEHFEDAGDLRNACTQRIQVGYAKLEFGDMDGALESLRSAADLSESMQLSNLIPAARMQLGRALCRSGNVDDGVLLLEKAASNFDRHRNLRMAGLTRVAIAEAHLSRGRLDLAEDAARRAVAILRPMPASRLLAEALLALTLVESGQPESAHVLLSPYLEDGSVGRTVAATRPTLLQLALAETLQALGRTQEAQLRIEDEVARLEEIAEGMDPEFAARFLDGTPERRRVRQLASESGRGAGAYGWALRPRATLPENHAHLTAAMAADLARLDTLTSGATRHLWLARAYLRLSDALAGVIGTSEASFFSLSAWAARHRASVLIRAELSTRFAAQVLARSPGTSALESLRLRLLRALGLDRVLDDEIRRVLVLVEAQLADHYIHSFRQMGPLLASFVDLLLDGHGDD